MPDICYWCEKPLNQLERVVSCEGSLYCSNTCALLSFLADHLEVESAAGTKYTFSDAAEVVATCDILDAPASCEYMNRNQILEAFRELAEVQGMYSSLYKELLRAKQDRPKSYDKYMSLLEQQQLKDAVDLVLYLES